jgi:hypothetical protein
MVALTDLGRAQGYQDDGNEKSALERKFVCFSAESLF